MIVRAASLVSLFVLASVACEKKPPSDSAPPPAATPAPSPKAAAKAIDAGPIEKVEVPEVRVRSEGTTAVRVTWLTPKGTAVNDEAPFRVRWNRSDGLAEAPSDVRSTGSAVKDGFSVNVRPMPGAPNATLGGAIDIVVCDSSTHSVCVPVRRSVELGFVVVKDAAREATVSIPLPEARAAD
jgi:hypothetical protein